MKKNALVSNFFPAIYDTETEEVTVIKSWQNGFILDCFVFAIKCYNWVYLFFFGADSRAYLKFRIYIETDAESRSNN